MTTQRFYNPAGNVSSHVRARKGDLVWSVGTSAWVAWVDANWANYQITATHVGDGRFDASVPVDADGLSLCLTGGTLAASPAVDIISAIDLATLTAVQGLGGTAFAGANAVTVTVTDGTNPVANAKVRITQGNVTQPATSANNGTVSASLDNGGYTVAITKPGYSFTPQTITVSSTATSFTLAMTSIVVPSPALPSQSVGTLTSFDATGAVKPSIAFSFKMIAGPGDDGASFSGDPFTASSNGSGLLSASFVKGATYEGSRADGQPIEFVVPDDQDSFELPEILGRAG